MSSESSASLICVPSGNKIFALLTAWVFSVKPGGNTWPTSAFCQLGREELRTDTSPEKETKRVVPPFEANAQVVDSVINTLNKNTEVDQLCAPAKTIAPIKLILF